MSESVTWCHAEVCEVDPHPKCLWAKISVRELNDPIMIHVEDGVVLRGGSEGPEASSISAPKPKLGDKVVFIPTITDFKMRSGQWGYEDDYYKAVKASRPLQYRCIVSYRYAGAKFFEPEQTVWHGTTSTISKFAEKTAMEYYDLEKHDHQLKTSAYTYVVRWEVSLDGGETWRKCECPDEYTHEVTWRRDL